MPRLAIDSHYLTDQLKALLAIASPTGYTDTVVRHVAKELERLGLKVELTRRGAISALRQGSRRASARAVVSHLDTLGAQVKRLKDLEKENERLRKAVSDLTLEKLILSEAASGNF